MLRVGRSTSGILLAAALASACSASSNGNGNENTGAQTEGQGSGASGTAGGAATVRAHPGRGRVRRVLNAAADRAQGCLPPAVNQGVTVSGAFQGPTGEFRITSIDSPQVLSLETRNCVREQFEQARVDPFTDATFEATRTFGIPDAGGVPPGVPVIAEGDAGGAATESGPSTGSGPAPAGTGNATTSGTAATTTGTGTTTGTATAASGAGEGPLLTSADVLPCYRNNVRLDPTLALNVRLSFGVNAQGAGENAHAEVVGTAHGRPPAVTQTLRCMERLANGHHFAPGAARTTALMLTLAPRRGSASAEVAVAQGSGAASTEPQPAPHENTPGGGTATATTATTATATAQPQDAGAAMDASVAHPPASSASAPTLDEVANVLRGRVNDLRNCYQSQLSRDASLNIHLRLRFLIEPAGTVSSASSTTVVVAGDADAAADVARCVEDVARATAFPAHPGAPAFEAALPFVFRPEAAGAAGTTAGGGTSAGTSPAGNGGGAAASGRVDTAAVSAVIRSQTAAVRNCYTTVLSMSPGLAGRVVLRFTVGTDGRISGMSSQAQPQAGDPNALGAVGHCIENIIGQLTLPPPTGGPAAVALPFDFGASP